jgi:hypothetical protein
MVQEGHEPLADSFNIVYSTTEKRLVRIAEAIIIQRRKPELNNALGPATLRIHPSGLKPEFQKKGKSQTPVGQTSGVRPDGNYSSQQITHDYNLRRKTETDRR